jgi:hypothetical protein
MGVTVRAATGRDAGAACAVARRSLSALCRADHQGDARVVTARTFYERRGSRPSGGPVVAEQRPVFREVLPPGDPASAQ